MFREKENREEVEIDDISSEIDTAFEDDETVEIEDEFNFTKDMFEDDDDEIDTTIPDGDMFDDEDDELELEDEE